MLLGSSALAFAKDPSDTDHAQRARVAYELRDWATAAREYRSAYETEAKSEYLFGLAQSLRQNHDYTAAIFTFKAYKRAEGVTAQQATAAELLLTQCEAEQAKAEALAAVAEAKAARPAAAAEGAPDSSDAAARAPTALGPPAEPAKATSGAPGRPAAARSQPFYADVLGDTLFIAGVGASGVGLALLLGGNASMRDSAQEPTESSAKKSADSAHSKQVLGGILCPIGGALVAGAVWRWISVTSDLPEGLEQVAIGPRFISVSGEF
jgi:hypothetical protein